MKLSKKVLSLLAVLALLGTLLSVIPVASVGAAAENLVVNGDFETGDLTGWSQAWPAANGTTVVWGSGHQRSGSYAAHLSGSGAPWGEGLMYQTIEVKAGRTYVFSAWMRYDLDNNANFYFAAMENETDGTKIYYNAADHANTLQKINVAPSNGSHKTYTKVTFEFMPTTTSVMIGWYQYGGNANNFNVDDVSVTEKLAVSMADKTITAGVCTNDSISLSWDAASGAVAAENITYSVYASESVINADNIADLTPFATVAGTAELTATAADLKADTAYYFAVKAADGEGNSDVIFAGPVRTLPAGITAMLLNENFENGIWSNVYDKDYIHSTNTAHSGSYSMAGNAWQWNPAYKEVTGLVPGETYVFSAWVMGGANTDAGVQLYVLEHAEKTAFDTAKILDDVYRANESNRAEREQALDDATLVHGSVGNAQQWIKVAYEFVPTYDRVTVIYNNCGLTGASYLDDVTIVKKDSYDVALNETFSNGNRGEFSVDNWNTEGLVNPRYMHENHYMKLTTYADFPLAQMVPVTPGKTYTVSAYMFGGSAGATGFGVVESATAHITTMTTAELDTLNTLEGVTVLGGYVFDSNLTEWTTKTFDITPTQSTVMIGLFNPSTTDNAYFDNISIVAKEDEAESVGTQIYTRGNALRFKFDLEVDGVTMDEETHVRDLSNASLFIGGYEYAVTDFGVILNVKEGATEADLTVGTTNPSSAQKSATMLTSMEEGKVTFVGRLDIPEGMTGRMISARAYVEYKDAQNNTCYLYSDTLVNSIDNLLQTLEDLENQ